MTWFRIDDSFPTHPKVLAIPRKDRPAAVGLWTLAGTMSARNLTDGVLGVHMVEELWVPKKFAAVLVDVRLWHPPGEDCDDCLECADAHKAVLPTAKKAYRYHCWHEYQPARAAIEKTRREDKERKAANAATARAAKAAKREAAEQIPAGPSLVADIIPYDVGRVRS